MTKTKKEKDSQHMLTNNKTTQCLQKAYQEKSSIYTIAFAFSFCFSFMEGEEKL